MAIAKIFRKAARAADRAKMENQKKPINELMSKDKGQQKESGMGTASKTRVTLGTLGAKTKGQADSLKQKMRQLNALEDKTGEKAQLLRNAIKDLKSRLPASVVKQVTESLDMNKGGYAKKKMAKGGYANCGASMPATQASSKKMAAGGMMKKPDNPGLKKLPTAVRNKMGYMAKGGYAKKK